MSHRLLTGKDIASKLVSTIIPEVTFFINLYSSRKSLGILQQLEIVLSRRLRLGMDPSTMLQQRVPCHQQGIPRRDGPSINQE